jgi:hypothetical protein
VYKGLWKGTVVAVKTMLLPSGLSGAEKREKMAIMETAISSSLSHPNVGGLSHDSMLTRGPPGSYSGASYGAAARSVERGLQTPRCRG